MVREMTGKILEDINVAVENNHTISTYADKTKEAIKRV